MAPDNGKTVASYRHVRVQGVEHGIAYQNPLRMRQARIGRTKAHWKNDHLPQVRSCSHQDRRADAPLMTDETDQTVRGARKPAAIERNKIPPVPLSDDRAVNPEVRWTDRKILIRASAIAVLAVFFVAVVFLAIFRVAPKASLATKNGDLSVPQTEKAGDELLPEAAEQTEQVEPKEVVKAVDVVKEQPAVILPPTSAEITKNEFDQLRALIREIQRNHNFDTAPIDEEKRLLQAEVDQLLRSNRRNSRDILQKGKQALALSSKMEVLRKQYEIRVATEVKEYVKRLEVRNVPEDVSSQYEQDEINKIILAHDSSPPLVKALVQRMEQGGDSVMTTRDGRAWVLFGVKLTL